jgi:hypothetical protein
MDEQHETTDEQLRSVQKVTQARYHDHGPLRCHSDCPRWPHRRAESLGHKMRLGDGGLDARWEQCRDCRMTRNAIEKHQYACPV